MSALERFAEWEARLEAGDEASPAPVETRGSAETALDLECLYDPQTLEAIDARTGEPRRAEATMAGWRGGAATGAVVVGLVQGVRDALEENEPDPVVEIEQLRRDGTLEPVTVHLAWGDPQASVAIVRRWLF
ncbi:MAG: hypothetical protein ACR2PK_12170 [Acidimicrobiales bacterium]